MKIVISTAAESDLAGIRHHIARDNPAAADRFLEKIRQTITQMAHSPHIGRRRDSLHPGLRSIPVGQYLVFARQGPVSLEIVRVLHGARDIDDGFFNV